MKPIYREKYRLIIGRYFSRFYFYHEKVLPHFATVPAPCFIMAGLQFIPQPAT